MIFTGLKIPAPSPLSCCRPARAAGSRHGHGTAPGESDVRAGRRLRVYPGESVAKLDVARDFPWLRPGSQQARDIERFRWFSNGYIAVEPGNPYRITDIRYSMVPNEIQGLWSIELSPQANPGDHVGYVVTRRADDRKLLTFRSMLFE